MTIIAPGYNVEGSPAAGFVKNDGSGNFSFGEAGPAGSPAIGSGWEVVEVKNITVDTTSVTFSGLNGDVDGEYLLLYRIRKVPATGSNQFYVLRPNGLTTNLNSTNGAHSGTGSNTVSTTSDMRISGGGQTAGVQTVGVLYLDAKTGTEARQYIADLNQRATSLSNTRRDILSGVWTDTTTNITSLDIVAALANGIAAGSQFCLYKKSSGRGEALSLIETIDVTSPVTTVSFTGLNGDVDKSYRLVWTIVKSGGPASPVTQTVLRPNGVTTGLQSTVRTNSASGASLGGVNFFLRMAQSGGITNDGNTSGKTLIMAETGKLLRTFKSEVIQSFPTFPGSPPRSLNNLTFSGFWNDNTTNLTSLDIVAVGGVHPIAVGSTFSLYRIQK
jgi:hypothetical protein